MPNYTDEAEVFKGTYIINNDVVRMEVDGESVNMFVFKENTPILGELFGGSSDGDLKITFKRR